MAIVVTYSRGWSAESLLLHLVIVATVAVAAVAVAAVAVAG